jgi:hypothetical protein
MERCANIISDKGVISLLSKNILSIVSKEMYVCFRRHIAAQRIINAWRYWLYYRKFDAWVNSCILHSVKRHSFPWRLQVINLPQFTGFNCGIPRWEEWRNITNYCTVSRQLCSCGERYINLAMNYSVGCKMSQSSPYLSFSCLQCALYTLQDDPYVAYDCYQIPVYTLYDKYIEDENSDFWSKFFFY